MVMEEAIAFAIYVTNEPSFIDFCVMTKEEQENIYRLFLQERAGK